MKLTNKIMTALIPAVMVTTPLMTTSCNKEAADLKLTINKGEHVTGVTTSGITKVGSSFLINCTFENGWKQIDSTNTKITVGEKELVLNTDYQIQNYYQILVKPGAINSTDVTINVAAQATCKSFDFNYLETPSTGKVISGVYCGVPGNKITKDDIVVTGTLGDGTSKNINFGTGDKEAKLFLDDADVTADFVQNGIAITEDMIKIDPITQKQKVTQLNLKVSCEDNGCGESVTLYTFAGYKPTSINVGLPKGGIVAGNQYWLESTGSAKEYTVGTFHLESGEEFAELTKEGFLTAKAVGSIKIKLTSLYDPEVFAISIVDITAA